MLIHVQRINKSWRAGYELKPARQAKRKEADATGPQGGYGIRLAWLCIEQKGCQLKIWYPFLFPGGNKNIIHTKNKI
jgi:hypothetical protein